MNKRDLIAAIAKHSNLSIADAERALKAILEVITAALKRGETITLAGFGSFSVKSRSPRVGRNPRSGQPLHAAFSRLPIFKVAKALINIQNAVSDESPPASGSEEPPAARPATVHKDEPAKRSLPAQKSTTARKGAAENKGITAKRGAPRTAPVNRAEMAAASEPEPDARRVNAQLRFEGKRRNTFVCGQDNVIRCWIGLPDPDKASVSDAPITTVDIPPEGLPLSVQVRWRGASKPKWIILPADRTARTQDCDFTLQVPENERFVSAEIIFRYQGSVFEFVRLEAFAIAADKAEEPHHDVRLYSVMDARQVIAIEGRQQVDATIIWGEDRSKIGGPDDQGSMTLRVFGKGSPEKFDLSDAGNAINWLNNELFITEKSLVRKKAGSDDASGGLHIDGSDKEVVHILRTLAEHGTELFNQLTLQGFKDPGARIQLINTEPEEYVPIEFVYDRGFPKKSASVCQPGLAALNSDAIDCPVCKPASELTLEERDGAAIICPFGFWSLRKIIERRDLKSRTRDTNAGATGHPSSPTMERRSLPAINTALFASSARVPPDELATTATTLFSLLDEPAIATDWTQWKAVLKQKKPPLLVMLPHHHVEANQDFLEIGAENLPDEERLLNRARMTDLFVNPDGADPGPIVILLGCRTAAETETGYVHLARRFQQLSTAIVMGTLAQILGRHAAPVARELVAELVAVSDAHADFGTIMLKVRRRMLAKGYLMALCLVALGDAEWRLTPRIKATGQQEPADAQT